MQADLSKGEEKGLQFKLKGSGVLTETEHSSSDSEEGVSSRATWRGHYSRGSSQCKGPKVRVAAVRGRQVRLEWQEREGASSKR